MKNSYLYIILVVGVVILLVVARANVGKEDRPGKVTQYDEFAQCLADAGAIFYGAYWCPHCQDQKEMFDNSSKLPYIECSTPNGQGQVQECSDEGITGYPTWVFADGSKIDGLAQFSDLSEKTGCVAPE